MSMLECLHTAQIMVHRNEFRVIGNELLELVKFRSTMVGYSKALMVCNAIKHLQSTSKHFDLTKLHSVDKNLITIENYETIVMESDIPKIVPNKTSKEAVEQDQKDMERKMYMMLKAVEMDGIKGNIADVIRRVQVRGDEDEMMLMKKLDESKEETIDRIKEETKENIERNESSTYLGL